jgi:hypothetical protein
MFLRVASSCFRDSTCLVGLDFWDFRGDMAQGGSGGRVNRELGIGGLGGHEDVGEFGILLEVAVDAGKLGFVD